MGANVRAKLGSSFLLDEERLRRLHQKITERSAALGDIFDFEYRVLRADTYSYTTKRIEDILAEVNSGHERLRELNLQSTKESEIEYYLSFGQNGITIQIDGDNRDAVFLLFSDVREYITSSIARRSRLAFFNSRLMLNAIPVIFSLALLFLYYQFSGIKAPLESEDLETKMNFLVQQQGIMNDLIPYMFGLMALIAISLVFLEAIPKIASRIWPPHVFLVGGEVARYEKRKRIQERLVWGVGVAFVVSALAGLLIGVFLT
jgi:hypothetical protein